MCEPKISIVSGCCLLVKGIPDLLTMLPKNENSGEQYEFMIEILLADYDAEMCANHVLFLLLRP